MEILVCDDHPLFRQALSIVLEGMDDECVVLEADDAEAAIALIQKHSALRLVLLDLDLPGADGLSTLRSLKEQYAELPVCIVSATDDPAQVRACLAAGAEGFVPKASPTPVLRSAFQLILSGGTYIPPQMLDAANAPTGKPGSGSTRLPLTQRQIEVAELLAKGRTNKEICVALEIAENTVKAHVKAIFETLGVTNRTEAAGRLRDLGLTGR